MYVERKQESKQIAFQVSFFEAPQQHHERKNVAPIHSRVFHLRRRRSQLLFSILRSFGVQQKCATLRFDDEQQRQRQQSGEG
jgi:hypothetical protein